MRIPDLTCPFEQHADVSKAEVADRWVSEWYRATGLFQHNPCERDWHEAGRIGALATLSYPDVCGDEQIMLGSAYLAMMNAIDDLSDEDGSADDPAQVGHRMGPVLSILHGPPAIPSLTAGLEPADSRNGHRDDDPALTAVCAATENVMERLARLASPAQIGRIRSELTALIAAFIQEAAWRSRRYTPTVAEYLSYRQRNGLTGCLAIIDVLGGYEVPPHAIDSAPVRELIIRASNVSMRINDLYSTHAETSAPVVNYSLPWLLRQHGWSQQATLDQTARLYQAELASYLAAEARLATSSASLCRFIAGLRGWIRGNLDWSKVTGRYHAKPAGLQRH